MSEERRRLRLFEPLWTVIRVLHTQKLIDNSVVQMFGLGRDPQGSNTLVSLGASITLFTAALDRWTEAGNISFSEAVRQVRNDLGSKQQEVAIAIEKLFNPIAWLKDLLPLLLNDKQLFNELKKDHEIVGLFESLNQKLNPKS